MHEKTIKISSSLSPIGIFDSGVGGITALKEIRKLMPGEDIIYFGDTERVPYGNKSPDTITEYARQDVAFLKSKGVKITIAACGTVSSIVDVFIKNGELPFIGVVTSSCFVAVNLTENKKIGIIGTEAAINSGFYEKCIKSIDEKITIYKKSCPAFVPLIESGIFNIPHKKVYEVVKENLAYFDGSSIDVLILGCTHYPIIEDVISEVIGPRVKIVNSGKEAAGCAKEFLKRKSLCSPQKSGGKCTFYVSGNADNFSDTVEKFLGCSVGSGIRKVNIDMY